MRHWRSALDHIYEHNANKALPIYTPRTDTEKALTDALKQLELQCKERIDLLEALRVSRQDSPVVPPTLTGKLSKSPEILDTSGHAKGSIGHGTIPAVTYSELSRPSIPHRPSPSEPRPSLPPRPSSDAAVVGSSSHTNSNGSIAVPTSSIQKSLSADRGKDTSSLRSPSPDRYTMRTTLRSGKSSDKFSRNSRKPSKPPGEGPSKAATLAWNALSSREKTSSTTQLDKPPVSQYSSQRHSSEQSRRPLPSQLQDNRPRRPLLARDADSSTNGADTSYSVRRSDEYPRSSNLSVSAASSALYSSSAQDYASSDQCASRPVDRYTVGRTAAPVSGSRTPRRTQARTAQDTVEDSGEPSEKQRASETPVRRRTPLRRTGESSRPPKAIPEQANRSRRRERPSISQSATLSSSEEEDLKPSKPVARPKPAKLRAAEPIKVGRHQSSDESQKEEEANELSTWKKKKDAILKNLPPGVDESAARQILNDIVVQGDEVHWSDIAGLDIAKNALREAVVYPFLRPDLFMGLREPARGMLLFGPPGTGKTMLARAVATESKSTFFSISASSLTSKYLGESEKLVRALFALAKVLAPSIIFVDEIDSLLSQRSGSGEHEATRRIKTEFLIQWSDLQRAAAGRETTERDKERGDANRVLVLAATNLPWAIDEAARRRFVRRQYIPLPEDTTRETQLRTLLGQQKHNLTNENIKRLVHLTDGKLGIQSFFQNTC